MSVPPPALTAQLHQQRQGGGPQGGILDPPAHGCATSLLLLGRQWQWWETGGKELVQRQPAGSCCAWK